jgi:AAA domain
MKVIGLSGAQGGGKSSLLAELENRGWSVDKFRVSRAVQAELGWDKLDSVMESWETMVQFQIEVFKQKFNHDQILAAMQQAPITSQPGQEYTCNKIDIQDEVIFVERTFADIAAYTSLWTWNHIDNQTVDFDVALDFLHQYVFKCATAQHQIYNTTILLPYMSDVISWENDPNRASFKDVECVYEDVVRFLERKVPITHKSFVITAKTIGDRATQVQNFLEQNWS